MVGAFEKTGIGFASGDECEAAEEAKMPMSDGPTAISTAQSRVARPLIEMDHAELARRAVVSTNAIAD